MKNRGKREGGRETQRERESGQERKRKQCSAQPRQPVRRRRAQHTNEQILQSAVTRSAVV